MLENRRSYRIPFREKFVYGTADAVHTGNALNISNGGIFISASEHFPRETFCKVLFQLRPEEAPVVMNAVVKRVAQGTSDPEDIPGLGFQFVGSETDPVMKRISNYMDECRQNYELAATILSRGEPELASIQGFLKKMHLPHFQDLGALRQYVERVLEAIEMVDRSQSAR